MKNLKLRTKLMLFIGLFFFITLITFGFLIVSYNKLQQLNVVKEQGMLVKEQILKLRKNEKNFLARETISNNFYITQASKYYVNFTYEITKLDSILSALQGNGVIKDGKFGEAVTLIKEDVKEYKKIFSAIVNKTLAKGYKDYGIVGELRDKIHEITNIAKEGYLMSHILTLRKHEKDFFIRKDLAYRDKFNAEIRTTLDLINVDHRSSANSKKIITEGLNSYSTSFNKAVNAAVEIGLNEKEGLMGEMLNAINKVEPKIKELIINIEEIDASEKSSTIYITIIIFTIGLLLTLTVGIMILKNITLQLGGDPSEVSKIANLIAKGDLTYKFDMSRESVGVYNSMRDMTNKLNSIIGNISSASTQIAASSAEMKTSSQHISEGATNQAASAEEVAGSMEEMSENIQQNTENAKQTESIALKASEDIQDGNNSVKQTVESMRNITDKISIIEEIARQTNLLALNAAVEAARAGEHGKGFAVVAAEIRKLAERSQDAAVEINKLTSSSLKISKNAGDKLETIVSGINKTATLVQEISAASNEQSSGAGQVNDALQELNNIVQQNAAASEQIALRADDLYTKGVQLKKAISFFKLNDNEANPFIKMPEATVLKAQPKESPIAHNTSLNNAENKGIEIDLQTSEPVDNEYEKF